VIAADTNVLIRLLVQDDQKEAAAARDLVAAARNNQEPVLVTAPVLCELEWVLESAYGATRRDIAKALQAFLDDAVFAVDGRESVIEALAHYRETAADFSDCLIVATARRAGARRTATFDRRLRRLPGCTVLRPQARRSRPRST
jgi:predicted nucleic-acid-binding protein